VAVGIDLDMEYRLEAFADEIANALRHSQWAGSLTALCSYIVGVLLPGERKSMEPIAERLDPEHTQAMYASIQRLITDSDWDHRVVLNAARDDALPSSKPRGGWRPGC
jgi:SRSO17 transposase